MQFIALFAVNVVELEQLRTDVNIFSSKKGF